ncbi:MAG: adenylate/guanylate cyclase domain-containing protein [Alphaproteobacteria bacterium]|nr:adenylate/guanylate cyclase domain-containing protein [Alphaproteobacteria bacterium]
MREDEVRTLSQLKSVRTAVIDPTVMEYRGRLFKAMGDGFLFEFGSLGDAVQCAIDMQQKIQTHNASQSDGQSFEFRMGLNVADIFPDKDDVYGDGVNIAARLEAFAKPSEICISGAVYEQIRHTFGNVFKRLGSRTLKNIDWPIEVYSARIGAPARTFSLRQLVQHRRARQSMIIASATVLFLAGISTLFVTDVEWSVSFDGKSTVAGSKPGATSVTDAGQTGDGAALAQIAAGAETEVARAKAEAVEAKAVAVRGALDAWKEASLALTEATARLGAAEAKLAELEGRAGALKEEGSGATATATEDKARQLKALMPRIRFAEEDLSRVLLHYQAAVKNEQRAKAHMEKVKADVQS